MSQKHLPLDIQKKIVIDFLKQCNDYSELMLNKYQQQLSDQDLKDSASQKIHDWNTYKDFNEYAINELDGDELDDWFK
ncbi:MAG: hypothetical protein ACJA2Y_001019 [Cycloclasticus pugetii]|jgi:hypothetical protein|uniref:hypothetical protein n=1 Tax=Cycloclasticus TaxID=34067 RepID=UPI0025798152|nr:hypothetical protein [Cycloclasticus sp.]MBV1898807.1 hypothetical protein [Cycloclasticus sp.]